MHEKRVAYYSNVYGNKYVLFCIEHILKHFEYIKNTKYIF